MSITVRNEFQNIKDVLDKMLQINSLTTNAANVRLTSDQIDLIESLKFDHSKIDTTQTSNGSAIWKGQYENTNSVANKMTDYGYWAPFTDLNFTFTIPDTKCIVGSLVLTKKQTSGQLNLVMNFRNRDTRYGSYSYYYTFVSQPDNTDIHAHVTDARSINQNSIGIAVDSYAKVSNMIDEDLSSQVYYKNDSANRLVNTIHEDSKFDLHILDNSTDGTDPCTYTFDINFHYYANWWGNDNYIIDKFAVCDYIRCATKRGENATFSYYLKPTVSGGI